MYASRDSRFRDDGSEIYVADNYYNRGGGPQQHLASSSSPRPPSALSASNNYYHKPPGSVLSTATTNTSKKRRAGVVVETMSAPNPFCPRSKGVCCLLLLVNLGLILVTLGFSIVLQLFEPAFVWLVFFVLLFFSGILKVDFDFTVCEKVLRDPVPDCGFHRPSGQSLVLRVHVSGGEQGWGEGVPARTLLDSSLAKED